MKKRKKETKNKNSHRNVSGISLILFGVQWKSVFVCNDEMQTIMTGDKIKLMKISSATIMLKLG